MSNLAKISGDYVTQSRSKYQLQKFVIEAHDTPEMQYRQILLEAQNLIYNIRMAELDLEKRRIRLSKLKESQDPIRQINAKELELGIAYTELVLEGSKRELKDLEDLFKQYPHYSPEDIDNNQPEYWRKRLSRQAKTDSISKQNGIAPGNLESILQITRAKEESSEDEIYNLET